jgi:site-specific DNA recombinase
VAADSATPARRHSFCRDTTIRGHISRGAGIRNNAMDIGRLVWNRQRFMQDPASGRRRSRRNDPKQMRVEEVIKLRIVSDELWAAVKARPRHARPGCGSSAAQHLLTGLAYCGSCGSRFASVGRDYLACSAARGQGTCTNRKGKRRAPLDELIV